MNKINRTRVKICGITNLEDANVAVSSGRDSTWVVFYDKSPRNVSISTAKYITANLAPFINCVGLFVDADESFVSEVLEQTTIDTLQFHGQETERACALYNKPYIKAVRMVDGISLNQEVEKYPSARALLLDTYIKGIPGGTGKPFEWSVIPEGIMKPIILAGGLDENNVKNAILQVHPYAVDVSGGVEREKGLKVPLKIKKFISETKNA